MLLLVEHVHDHLALGAVDGELGTTRRAQADEVQPGRAARGQDAAGDPQGDPGLAPDQVLGQERQGRTEAGREDEVSRAWRVPSTNSTSWPSNCRRPGAGWIRPCWIQCSTRLFTTGRWSLRLFATGFGRPYASGDPTDIQMSRRSTGSRGEEADS